MLDKLYCPYCGGENTLKAKFCRKCGKPIKQFLKDEILAVDDEHHALNQVDTQPPKDEKSLDRLDKKEVELIVAQMLQTQGKTAQTDAAESNKKTDEAEKVIDTEGEADTEAPKEVIAEIAPEQSEEILSEKEEDSENTPEEDIDIFEEDEPLNLEDLVEGSEETIEEEKNKDDQRSDNIESNLEETSSVETETEEKPIEEEGNRLEMPNEGSSGAQGAEATNENRKSINKHIFIWVGTFLLGGLGVDRFLRGQIPFGVLKLVTLGGFGVWALIDFILALIKIYGDSRYSDKQEVVFINGLYAEPTEAGYVASEGQKNSASEIKEKVTLFVKDKMSGKKEGSSGQTQVDMATEGAVVKSINKHIFVWVASGLLGGIGLDRFLRGQTLYGVLKLLTLGGCGAWGVVDLIIGIMKAYGASFKNDKELVFVDGLYAK